MWCTNCGKELEGEMKFCPYCGMRQESKAENEGKNRATRKGYVFAFLAVCMGIILVVAGAVRFYRENKKNTLAVIDLQNYIDVRYNGADGDGEAYVFFDYAAFNADIVTALMKKGKIKEKAFVIEPESYTDYEGFSEIRRQVIYDLDRSICLSNGEAICLTFHYDNEILEKYGICFVGDSIQLAVYGLE